MKHLLQTDPQVHDVIRDETARQKNNIELIASENFTHPAVNQAVGSILTNKYAEGRPGNRYYGGCAEVDKIEELAITRAKTLFNTGYVNVQPHSGASANFAVFNAFMSPGDTLLGLDLNHGGHLTHGSPVNFSGRIYNSVFYGVDSNTGRIDMEEVRKKAKEVKPKMISIGGSAYTRDIDYSGFRDIADDVGAILWTDMAHTAGLIAAGLLNNPIPYSDVVTTTTHKTLRGPRGGMILAGEVGSSKEYGGRQIDSVLDSSVFPGTQGGPLMHVIAGKAVCFKLGLHPEFKEYQSQIIKNSQALADELLTRGYNLVSGGTDNHLVLVDLTDKGISGLMAEDVLDACRLTVNKNMIPFDTRSPFNTSGIRIGAPAMTTRGFKESEFRYIGELIDRALSNLDSPKELTLVRNSVDDLVSSYPMFAQ